jgi:hypothetical protein
VQTPDWTLPASQTDNLATGHEHRDDPAEPLEAESVPLFSDSEEETLDKALSA